MQAKNISGKSLFLFLFLVTDVCYSQSITGFVINRRTNEPLPFANAILYDTLMQNQIIGAQTDINGQFQFVSPSQGIFSLKVYAAGFGDTIAKNIKIVKDTILTFYLPRPCPDKKVANGKKCPICHKKDKVIAIKYISTYQIPLMDNGGTPPPGPDSSKLKFITRYDGVIGDATQDPCAAPPPNWFCKRDKLSF